MASEKLLFNNDGLSLTNIKKYILPLFSLENASVSMVKFKDTDKQRAVFKIETERNSYCLKKVYYNEESLLFVYSAMEWLYRNNLNVPRLLPSKNNSRFVLFNNMIFILTPWVAGDKCDFDNSTHINLSCQTLGKIHKVSKNFFRFVLFNNMIFILTPWVAGDKCDFDNSTHINLSCQTLGKIHKVSKNFFPIEGSTKREGLEDFHLSTSKHFNQLLENANYANNIKDRFSNIYLNNLGLEDFHLSTSKHFNQLLENANYANNIKDRFSNIYLNNLDYNLDLAKLSLEISSTIDSSDLSTSLCHGDYVNKNIIIDDKDNVFIIDFDKCKYDYSSYDISYFLRRLLKRPTTNWDVQITIDVLNSYLKENTLTPSDFKYILAYLAFPQKYWKISRDYYKNIKKCNKKSFVTLLEKGLERTANQLEYINNMIIILEKYYNVKF